MSLTFEPFYTGKPCITYGNAEDVCIITAYNKSEEENISLSAAEIQLRGQLKNERVFKMRSLGRDICLSIPAMEEIIAAEKGE